MNLLMISALIALSGFLGIRLHAANVENSALRASVAQLKRRLGARL
jgi:hypothetical protein